MVVHRPRHYALPIGPRFCDGEHVRIVGGPDAAGLPAGEGTVDEVVGPTADGAGWAVAVRVGDELRVLPEDALEPAAPSAARPPERVDTLRLRLVTELTDGVRTAAVAERLERVVGSLAGPGPVTIVAERHWAEPYSYELEVEVRPEEDAVGALRRLVAAGAGGWLSCRDDGWRCELWWSAGDGDPGFLVREVRGAEVTLLPWSSPALRPDSERPLVSV